MWNHKQACSCGVRGERRWDGGEEIKKVTQEQHHSERRVARMVEKKLTGGGRVFLFNPAPPQAHLEVITQNTAERLLVLLPRQLEVWLFAGSSQCKGHAHSTQAGSSCIACLSQAHPRGQCRPQKGQARPDKARPDKA